MLHRRDALKVMTGAVVSFILPAPRPRLDLMAFCSPYEPLRYDMRLPWEVADFVYATDAKICVRVRPEIADAVQRQGRVPPFGRLVWDHDMLTGWRTLPKREPILAADSSCPACDGTVAKEIPEECEPCGGTGYEWRGSGYAPAHPYKCRTCNGRGHLSLAGECPSCQGDAVGVFPELVELDGDYFDVRLYEKARGLGAEYVKADWDGPTGHKWKQPGGLMRFRFQDGDGLLCAIERGRARERIDWTKGA